MGLLAILSAEEAGKLVREGEQAAWPKIERTRNCTMVGLSISRIRKRLETVTH